MSLYNRRFRKKGPLPFRYVFLLTFVFFIFSTATGLWIINKGITPTLMDVAEKESERIATLVINNAVNKQIKEGMETEGLTNNVTTDEDGYIYITNIDTGVINSISAQITNRVQQNLAKVRKGNVNELEVPDVDIETEGDEEGNGVIFNIPLGQATNNALLGNLGPSIPVLFYMVGSVKPNVIYEMEPWGINNVLLIVKVELEVNVQVVIPFATETVPVTTDVILVSKVFQGKVPDFYNGGGDTPPSIEIPMN
ncbi:sporulation protein YunB [Cytobacillus sp. Hm23]